MDDICFIFTADSKHVIIDLLVYKDGSVSLQFWESVELKEEVITHLLPGVSKREQVGHRATSSTYEFDSVAAILAQFFLTLPVITKRKEDGEQHSLSSCSSF